MTTDGVGDSREEAAVSSLHIWTRREVCGSKSHVYGVVISSWRIGCLVRELSNEKLRAVEDIQPLTAPRGFMCPSPGRY